MKKSDHYSGAINQKKNWKITRLNFYGGDDMTSDLGEGYLYKYRSFSAESLALMINKELYFASPKQLNDPFDCQYNLPEALKAAFERVDEATSVSLEEMMARVFGDVDALFKKMTNDWENLGVLSLSKISDDHLMWTHYADDHRGFCLEFELNEPFTQLNEYHQIIGRTDVSYSENNPFTEIFTECAQLEHTDDDWGKKLPMLLLGTGMITKAEAWKYEQEVRVLRKVSGVVPFEPDMLTRVIFGGRMSERDRRTIKTVLSGEEWSHVMFSEIEKSEHDLSFRMKECRIA